MTWNGEVVVDEADLRERHRAIGRMIGRGLAFIAGGVAIIAVSDRLPDTSWLWLIARVACLCLGAGTAFVGASVVLGARGLEQRLREQGLVPAPEERSEERPDEPKGLE